MKVDDLAIHGGRPVLRKAIEEGWRTIRVGDLWPIWRMARRGINTAYGKGSPAGRFERDFARRVGAPYAVAMNSGTSALHSAFFAVGVRPGDEVLVPSYAFAASVTPILQCGAVPVFCDVDARTLTLAPAEIERKSTERTRAVCVVHVWGNPAQMDRIVELAGERNIAIVEDCSHAHGATFQGRSVGSWGEAGCFSLQGNKAVSGGEAGIAVTRDAGIHDRMLVLGHFGRGGEQVNRAYEIGKFSLGVKYRPHLFAMLLAERSLERLEELNRLRTQNYARLGESLADCPALETIASYPDARRGGFLEFILRYRPEEAGGWNLGAFLQAVRAEGVPAVRDRYTQWNRNSGLLHDSALFHESWAEELGVRTIPSAGWLEDFPVSRTLPDQLITLPAWTDVAADSIPQVGQALKKVVNVARGQVDLRK